MVCQPAGGCVPVKSSQPAGHRGRGLGLGLAGSLPVTQAQPTPALGGTLLHTFLFSSVKGMGSSERMFVPLAPPLPGFTPEITQFCTLCWLATASAGNVLSTSSSSCSPGPSVVGSLWHWTAWAFCAHVQFGGGVSGVTE